MRAFELRVVEDVIRAGASLTLADVNRVIYVIDGRVTITAGPSRVLLVANEAWHGSSPCRLEAGSDAEKPDFCAQAIADFELRLPALGVFS